MIFRKVRGYKDLLDIALLFVLPPVALREDLEVLKDVDEGVLPELSRLARGAGCFVKLLGRPALQGPARIGVHLNSKFIYYR